MKKPPRECAINWNPLKRGGEWVVSSDWDRGPDGVTIAVPFIEISALWDLKGKNQILTTLIKDYFKFPDEYSRWVWEQEAKAILSEQGEKK